MLGTLRSTISKVMGKSISGLDGMDASDRDLILRIRSRKLTYLSERKLRSIAETCRTVEKERVEGIFIEAGCALGGSSILIASVKADLRPFQVYDVFGMIPAPTKDDTQDVHDRYRIIVEGKASGIDRDKYYGYEENLYETVNSNLRSFGIDCEARHVSLIRGLLQDTMHLDRPVAVAHVDVDWYEPVKTCLARIWPHLSVGGSVILDDYHDWGGCRKAADEYLRMITGQFGLDDSAGSLKITKVRP